MNKKLTLFLITIVFASFVFSSYEHGAAYEGSMNRTGSDGGPANCAGSGCHVTNQSSTAVSIEVKDAANNIVTHYVPGNAYKITINGHNTLATPLNQFGFQLSTTSAAHAQSGSLAATSGSHVRIVNLSGIQIAEHKDPIDESSTNTYSATVNWTAPTAGSGNVTVYGILNATPGEGGDDDDDDGDDRQSVEGSYHRTTGDASGCYPNIAPQVVLTEASASAVSMIYSAPATVCYPNPFVSTLNLKISNVVGATEIALYDINGRSVLATTAAGSDITLSTEQLPVGVYMLKAVNNGIVTLQSVLKK